LLVTSGFHTDERGAGELEVPYDVPYPASGRELVLEERSEVGDDEVGKKRPPKPFTRHPRCLD